MATAITPIATYTVASALNTVVFSSIPGTYQDLMLTVRGPITTSGSLISFKSGATTTWRTWISSYGAGSTLITGTGTSNQFYSQTGSSPTDVAMEVHIFDYAQTNKVKPVTMQDSGGTNNASMTIGFIDTTSAISSLTVLTYGGSTLAAGMTINLYGVSA